MTPRNVLFLALSVVCASPAVQAQTCQPNIRETTPASRFVVDAAKGTVLDTSTGLMWKRCVEGQSGAECSNGSYSAHDWAGALTLAANSTHAGYNDWRLPNYKEIESIVEEKCYNPAINATVFPDTPSDWHWSGSPNAGNSGHAWFVSFGYGSSYFSYRYDDYAVRLVRGGQ